MSRPAVDRLITCNPAITWADCSVDTIDDLMVMYGATLFKSERKNLATSRVAVTFDDDHTLYPVRAVNKMRVYYTDSNSMWTRSAKDSSYCNFSDAEAHFKTKLMAICTPPLLSDCSEGSLEHSLLQACGQWGLRDYGGEITVFDALGRYACLPDTRSVSVSVVRIADMRSYCLQRIFEGAAVRSHSERRTHR